MRTMLCALMLTIATMAGATAICASEAAQKGFFSASCPVHVGRTLPLSVATIDGKDVKLPLVVQRTVENTVEVLRKPKIGCICICDTDGKCPTQCEGTDCALIVCPNARRSCKAINVDCGHKRDDPKCHPKKGNEK